MDKKLKICCITGHREIAQDKIEFTKSELHKRITLAIEAGYNFFISGFADNGADLLFAEIVIDQKKEHKLYLEAAIPYPRNSRPQRVQELLSHCDFKHIISARYHPACFRLRNEYMVDQSELVIAVYDGRQTGGTNSTIKYARLLGKEIQIITV